MNPTETNLSYAIYGESYTPTIIDERKDETMYIGYCLPTCTGADSPKWLIKKIVKTTITIEQETFTLQSILFPNGSRDYTNKWSERENLIYKVCVGAAEAYTPDDYKNGKGETTAEATE